MSKNLLFRLLVALTVLSMILAACGAPAEETEPPVVEATQPPAPEATEPPAPEATNTTAPEPTEPPAAEDYSQAAREETVIFDIDGGRVIDPEMWNMYPPGSRLDQGFHQAIIEPLFVLNYETGDIEPWLGLSMTPNDAFDLWTLKLREGVYWSDGEAYNADDVVFTIQMLLDNAPDLNWSAGLKEWIKEVKKVDDFTVEFTLNKPNPRFQLDNFSVRIWGGPSIVPEHIWKDQDPLTFKNYDPEQGWPVFTGPYKLSTVGETEFSYVRDDNWWGAKAGFQPLPVPKKLVWTWYGPEETRAAAMAQDNLDSLMDITLGALQALQAQNPNVITHYTEAPYAWVPDPCSRTFEFNLGREPWNTKEMRWAVNYAIDRDQIVQIAYEGTTFKSRHFFPAYPPLDRYVDLVDQKWLDQLWTYDPDKSKEMIEALGWTMGSDGYYEKDGKQLTMDITTHEAFIEKQRIAQVLVEQFQAVGINASTRNETGAAWGDNLNFGTFDTQMGWQMCGSVNEPWASMDILNVKWLLPEGERASGNPFRWQGPAAEEYSKLVDQIGVLALGDPAIDDLFLQAMNIYYEELPVIPITQAKKIIPFNTTYWTNWPTADNPYIHPPTWWEGNTELIIINLKPAQ